jgi:hypothetical protein
MVASIAFDALAHTGVGIGLYKLYYSIITIFYRIIVDKAASKIELNLKPFQKTDVGPECRRG